MDYNMGYYKGCPIYWKSDNDKCIIIYNQHAFMNRYTLYMNDRYFESSDSLGNLITLAKDSYWYKNCY